MPACPYFSHFVGCVLAFQTCEAAQELVLLAEQVQISARMTRTNQG